MILYEQIFGINEFSKMMDLDVDEYGTKVQECLVVVLVGGEGDNKAVVKVNPNEDKAVKKAQSEKEDVNKIGNFHIIIPKPRSTVN